MVPMSPGKKCTQSFPTPFVILWQDYTQFFFPHVSVPARTFARERVLVAAGLAVLAYGRRGLDWHDPRKWTSHPPTPQKKEEKKKENRLVSTTGRTSQSGSPVRTLTPHSIQRHAQVHYFSRNDTVKTPRTRWISWFKAIVGDKHRSRDEEGLRCRGEEEWKEGETKGGRRGGKEREVGLKEIFFRRLSNWMKEEGKLMKEKGKKKNCLNE